jgi:uncharacterized membrane protein YfcA
MLLAINALAAQEMTGYIAALIIGISLGLIGAGGSILTVPVLVYLLGVEPVLATAYSLFIVGTTALMGSVDYMRKKLVNYKAALIFAIPSFVAVFLTRKFVVPAIPAVLWQTESFTLTKSVGVMLFFALIMAAAAISMIRNGQKNGATESETAPVSFNLPMIGLEGFLVGALTGLVGAGGGFLIIPALVLFAKLPMKQAVGTSLLIIAAKSLIGFTGDIGQQPIDWHFLITFTTMPIVGIFIGGWLARFISGEKLKKGFGWFVLVMAAYMIYKELG